MTHVAISNILIYIRLLIFLDIYLVIVNDFFNDTNGSRFV
jgi:hypothetical protein